MRSFLEAIGITVAGYLIGAVCGFAAIQAVSNNTHDKDIEAGMTGAFVTGPLVAVLAVAVWLVRRAVRSRQSR